MRTLIKMPYENETVLVAVDIRTDISARDRIQKTSTSDYIKSYQEPEKGQSYDKVTEMIVKYSKPIIESFGMLKNEKIPLQKATAEFGLGFSVKGDIYLIEASTMASIKVSLEWQL